jgi:hypothetical protein
MQDGQYGFSSTMYTTPVLPHRLQGGEAGFLGIAWSRSDSTLRGLPILEVAFAAKVHRGLLDPAPLRARITQRGSFLGHARGAQRTSLEHVNDPVLAAHAAGQPLIQSHPLLPTLADIVNELQGGTGSYFARDFLKSHSGLSQKRWVPSRFVLFWSRYGRPHFGQASGRGLFRKE